MIEHQPSSWWRHGTECFLKSCQVLSYSRNKFAAFYGTREFTRSHHLFLSQAISIQPMPPFQFLTIHFNIILHLRVGLPSALIPSGFPTTSLCAHFLSPIHATRSAHLTLLDLITRIIFGEEYRSYSSSVCSLLQLLTPTFRTSIYFFICKLILTHCIEKWKYEHVCCK